MRSVVLKETVASFYVEVRCQVQLWFGENFILWREEFVEPCQFYISSFIIKFVQCWREHRGPNILWAVSVCQKIILLIVEYSFLYFDLWLWFVICYVMFSKCFCEYWSRLIPALAMGQLIDSERLVKQWFPPWLWWRGERDHYSWNA